MSALMNMLFDFIPYFVLSLLVTPSAFLIEEKYKVNARGFLGLAFGSAAGYRLFSYVPQIAVIAYIASAYAFSGSVMPRSSANVRMIYALVLATLFAIALYFVSYFAR